jgi:two-component system response regulator AdeR
VSVQFTPASPLPRDAGDRRDGPILVIEPDSDTGSALVEQLRADRLHAMLVHSAQHARALARAQAPRAVVLGELEPPRGALDLLEEIRGRRCEPGGQSDWDESLPAIVLNRGDAQLELLRAFEAGADDFISQPVSYLELRVRLKALLRRTEAPSGTRVLRVGSLEIDMGAHAVRFRATPVDLCRLEYELLTYLARSPTAVCSKRELLGAIWKRSDCDGARTVDSHASRLRRKLEVVGACGFVVNVWGVGYRLI